VTQKTKGGRYTVRLKQPDGSWQVKVCRQEKKHALAWIIQNVAKDRWALFDGPKKIMSYAQPEAERKKVAPFRDFPEDRWGRRKAVCKQCGCIMTDFESSIEEGEYRHPRYTKDLKKHPCRNAGRSFDSQDTEIEPFMRKAVRRRLKRLGIRL